MYDTAPEVGELIIDPLVGESDTDTESLATPPVEGLEQTAEPDLPLESFERPSTRHPCLHVRRLPLSHRIEHMFPRRADGAPG